MRHAARGFRLGRRRGLCGRRAGGGVRAVLHRRCRRADVHRGREGEACQGSGRVHAGADGERCAFFRANADPARRRASSPGSRPASRALERAAGCRVVPERADVAVSMSASGAGELVFTILVQNRGPGRAIAASVTDPLPRGVELVSATSTSGSCSGGQNVTCSLKTLTPGAKATVTISTRRYLAGVIENTVSAEAATPDPRAANNSATARSTDLPLPAASSGPACSPELTFPGPRAYFHLGPTNYALYQQAAGRLGAVLLFVDFPDAPSTPPRGRFSPRPSGPDPVVQRGVVREVWRSPSTRFQLAAPAEVGARLRPPLPRTIRESWRATGLSSPTPSRPPTCSWTSAGTRPC